jgi:hypothetical protein
MQGSTSEDVYPIAFKHYNDGGTDLNDDGFQIRVHQGNISLDTTSPPFDLTTRNTMQSEAASSETDFYDYMDGLTGALGNWWDQFTADQKSAIYEMVLATDTEGWSP